MVLITKSKTILNSIFIRFIVIEVLLIFAAVGIYSNIRRQPPEQSLTYRNKNIAIFYCSLRVLANAIPPQVSCNR